MRWQTLIIFEQVERIESRYQIPVDVRFPGRHQKTHWLTIISCHELTGLDASKNTDITQSLHKGPFTAYHPRVILRNQWMFSCCIFKIRPSLRFATIAFHCWIRLALVLLIIAISQRISVLRKNLPRSLNACAWRFFFAWTLETALKDFQMCDIRVIARSDGGVGCIMMATTKNKQCPLKIHEALNGLAYVHGP